MRKIEIIGNLTKKPEVRTTQSGKDVTTFDVAVYVTPEKSDFYRVSAWNKLGESCAKFLDKGRKVYVRGDFTASIYNGRDGARLSLDVTASEVEFLSPKEEPKKEKKQSQEEDLSEWATVHSADLPF